VRTIALLAVMAGFAAGCSLGSAGTHATAPNAAATPHSHYRANGISFSYPAAWSHHRHGFYTTETDGFVDLSTQPMVDPCRPAGNGRTCGWPLQTLHPGGVVVMWATGGDIDPAALPSAGTTVKVTRPGDCRSLDGDETVLARIITPRRSVFSVDACLRAPGLAAHERAFRTMLASARAISLPVVLQAFHGGGVSFSYPASWSHRPGYLSNESDGIVDLSTQRMVNPCRHHGNITTCDLPIDHLRPGGVVVTWTIDGLPRAPSDVPRPGVHVTVSRPGYCQTIGSDESLLARVVTRKHEILWMDACLRGPRLLANERAVRAMLASAR
jgi:hypothetical protein